MLSSTPRSMISLLVVWLASCEAADGQIGSDLAVIRKRYGEGFADRAVLFKDSRGRTDRFYSSRYQVPANTNAFLFARVIGSPAAPRLAYPRTVFSFVNGKAVFAVRQPDKNRPNEPLKHVIELTGRPKQKWEIDPVQQRAYPPVGNLKLRIDRRFVPVSPSGVWFALHLTIDRETNRVVSARKSHSLLYAGVHVPTVGLAGKQNRQVAYVSSDGESYACADIFCEFNKFLRRVELKVSQVVVADAEHYWRWKFGLLARQLKNVDEYGSIIDGRTAYDSALDSQVYRVYGKQTKPALLRMLLLARLLDGIVAAAGNEHVPLSVLHGPVAELRNWPDPASALAGSLHRQMRGKPPAVRERYCLVLGMLPVSESADALVCIVRRDKDDRVKRSAAAGLRHWSKKNATPAVGFGTDAGKWEQWWKRVERDRRRGGGQAH